MVQDAHNISRTGRKINVGREIELRRVDNITRGKESAEERKERKNAMEL